MTVWPRFTPVADHALLVSFADSISDEASQAVITLDRALALNPPLGYAECVPALINLLIDFDPLLTDHSQICAHVTHLLKLCRTDKNVGQSYEVEICYEDEFAPDLSAVSLTTGLSLDAVVDIHLNGSYQVRMYGFAPGFAYMSGVPSAIQVPRKPVAVRDIPAGSVIIAAQQCLVTTLKMPTGWSIIGRSPTRIFTPNSSTPFLFEVGDTVRFKRIDRAHYERHSKAVALG